MCVKWQNACNWVQTKRSKQFTNLHIEQNATWNHNYYFIYMLVCQTIRIACWFGTCLWLCYNFILSTAHIDTNNLCYCTRLWNWNSNKAQNNLILSKKNPRLRRSFEFHFIVQIISALRRYSIRVNFHRFIFWFFLSITFCWAICFIGITMKWYLIFGIFDLVTDSLFTILKSLGLGFSWETLRKIDEMDDFQSKQQPQTTKITKIANKKMPTDKNNGRHFVSISFRDNCSSVCFVGSCHSNGPLGLTNSNGKLSSLSWKLYLKDEMQFFRVFFGTAFFWSGTNFFSKSGQFCWIKMVLTNGLVIWDMENKWESHFHWFHNKGTSEKSLPNKCLGNLCYASFLLHNYYVVAHNH